MISTIVRIGFLNLKNGDSEIVLTLTVPLIFFSIFALIFDNGIGGGGTGKVKIVLVDEDRTPASQELLRAIANDPSMRVIKGDSDPADEHRIRLVERTVAKNDVGNGLVKAAIIVPKGWSGKQSNNDDAAIEIFSDSVDPVAKQIVYSVVKNHSIQAALGNVTLRSPPSDVRTGSGSPADEISIEKAPRYEVGPYTTDQQNGIRSVRKPDLTLNENGGEINPSPSPNNASLTAEIESQTTIREIDFVGNKKSNPVLSSYAAGIVVVFVLFSATGYAGTLLDENESQTLERMLNGKISMTQILLGKWVFIFAVGFAQVFCMFTWAMLYGIDFTTNFAGFLVMTIGTVAAATSFAMLLATLCKTRAQLNTVSTIVILTMSAMGGSMVPRYVMSETMQWMGKITFNAWALDGYNKVFWYGLPVVDLQFEFAVLVIAAIGLFAMARGLAFRWERVA